MIRTLCIIVSLAVAPLVHAQWCGQQYYYYPSYTPAYTPPPPPRPSIVNNNTFNYPGRSYQELLVELAQIREGHFNSLRKAQLENDAFIRAVGAFGINGQSGYGYQQQSYGSLGSTGQSLYGYSAQTVLNSYGSADLNALYLQASQLTRGAQSLAGQAHTEFSDLVGQAGQNQTRVAEILARAEAASRVLNSLEQQKTTITTNVNEFGTRNGGFNGNGTNGNGNTGQALANVLQNKCYSCHNPSNRSGGFQTSEYGSLSPEEKGYVISLLTTNDASKRMPRIPDGTRLGKPGSLAPEEIETFKR